MPSNDPVTKRSLVDALHSSGRAPLCRGKDFAPRERQRQADDKKWKCQGDGDGSSYRGKHLGPHR
jgi:hypothetical protein